MILDLFFLSLSFTLYAFSFCASESSHYVFVMDVLEPCFVITHARMFKWFVRKVICTCVRYSIKQQKLTWIFIMIQIYICIYALGRCVYTKTCLYIMFVEALIGHFVRQSNAIQWKSTGNRPSAVYIPTSFMLSLLLLLIVWLKMQQSFIVSCTVKHCIGLTEIKWTVNKNPMIVVWLLLTVFISRIIPHSSGSWSIRLFKY